MILEMRYGINHEELTQKDIADQLGISQVIYLKVRKTNYPKASKSVDQAGIKRG